MNYNKKSVEDIDVKGKRVLCRCDFNVPTKEGKITSDKRIGAGSGMTLPYNGVCGRRECTEICRCATRRRGRRPLQRTAGSLGRFSAFRLPRAFLSCQIQKSDRLIWVSRSGF